ncbi:MAG: hypothetical protein ACXVPQ_10320 [Bacteroidia bacterium]
MKAIPLCKTIFWLCLFAIAMGLLESAVVIYLRELYYPGGFKFPLQIIPEKIAKVELWREAATIVMLTGAGYFAGNSRLTRFASFLIAFAVWDIFYYVFLYLFIQWPESLFTWDILFLIPFPWTGPVIAPCLVASGMCFFGTSILYFSRRKKVSITPSQWLLLVSGVFIIILSFLSDYFSIMQAQHREASFLPDREGLLLGLSGYIPREFSWGLFGAGTLMCCAGILLFIKTASANSILTSDNNL